MNKSVSYPKVMANIGAGLVTSSVSLAYCFSYGALIFAGPLRPFLGAGIMAALICAVVAGILISLYSGFPAAVAGPDSNTAALLAAMTAALAPALITQSPMGALYLAFVALGVVTLLTGGSLYLLGKNRLGRLGRFIPYPVLAGFQGASGWLMAAGAIRMSTGVPVRLSTLPDFFATTEVAATLAVTVAWAAILSVVTDRFKHFSTLPIALIAAILASNLILSSPHTADWAQASNWMFAVSGGMHLTLPIIEGQFWSTDFTALLPISGEMAAVVIMAALSIVLACTSIEQATGAEVDLDHELRAQGLANIASALCGGIVGQISLSRTLMARDAGATGRLAGVVVGLVALVMLGGGVGIIGYVPRFVLSGLLLQMGARLMWRWCIGSRKRLALTEWLLVPLIVVTTALFGVLIGFLIGILGGCVIFAVSVSRVEIVKREYSGCDRASTLVRSAADMAILAQHGGGNYIIELSSFIFFGSAYRLQERITRLVETVDAPRLIIFDFAAVSGIDSSAGSSLLKIYERLRDKGIRHVAVGLTPGIRRLMVEAGALNASVQQFTRLDDALEFGENILLESHGVRLFEVQSLLDWFVEALGDKTHAQDLIEVLQPAVYVEPSYLCRQGDATDTLLFVEKGRVSVEVSLPGQPVIRHRVYAANTVLGEVGFFLDAPRTADLRISEGARIWSLSRAAYGSLCRERPGLVAALLTYTVRIQAERLSFANRQVAALQN